ncbi:MAG: hypothetical protein QXQ46_09670 [Thermoplasmatales archaeon]
MSLLSKNRQYFINDPLKFMKDAIEWSAFPTLLKDLYHNYTKKKEVITFNNNHGQDTIPPVTIC